MDEMLMEKHPRWTFQPLHTIEKVRFNDFGDKNPLKSGHECL